MTAQSLFQFLDGLASNEERAKELLRLSHDLTICAREFHPTLDADVEGALAVKKLLGFNELQHKLSSQIGHYVDGDAKTYPVDVFSQILFDLAEHYEILPHLRSAVRKVTTGSWKSG